MEEGIGEPSEIAFQLLADWWMNSVQALVDSVGSEKAVELLRPHYRNAGIAGMMIAHDAFYHGGKNDLIGWYFNMKICADFLTRRDPRIFRVEIRENGLVSYLNHCPFKDGPVEICKLVCEVMPNASLMDYDPLYEKITISRLSEGKAECLFVTKPKSWPVPNDFDELGRVKAEILPRNFPKSTVDDFSIQYLAEFWVISTRGFIDLYGNKPSPILLSYMRHSGTSFGLRYLRSSPPGARGMDTIKECIGLGNKALQMKVEGTSNVEGSLERTITECPFKDAPSDVCKQIESFCQGICEAIDPDFHFKYDRMMTKGDKTCHWVIRNKVSSVDSTKNEQPESDSLKILKLRFAKGEITTEEFKEMKSLLE